MKEKLKGFEYHTVNYWQMKVLGLEFKLKNAKDTYKPHRSNTHLLDHDSDSSDDESRKYMQLHLFGHQSQTRFSSVSQANSKELARGAEIYF